MTYTNTEQEPEPKQQKPEAAAAAVSDPGFNLDEILHMDSIPGLANILADDSLDFGHKGRGVQNFRSQP